MGRNIKEGLNYFPLDVDIFEDEKIQFVSARFGVKGDGIVIRLLCKIYRQGYYIKFDDDVALLFARSVGDVSLHGLVKDVVNELIKREFFDRTIFDSFGILTSKGIQKRYTKICSDLNRTYVRIEPKFDLISLKKSFPPEEMKKIPEEMDFFPEESAQRKGKEKKGNERGKNSCAHETPQDNFFPEFIEIHEALTGSIFLNETCASKSWDSNDFYAFAINWLEAKRLSGDYLYKISRLKYFLISDFEKKLNIDNNYKNNTNGRSFDKNNRGIKAEVDNSAEFGTF